MWDISATTPRSSSSSSTSSTRYSASTSTSCKPQARLSEKVREGSRVKKRYDEPKTPYRRILEDPEVDEVTKRKLRRKYKKLNPAQLMREINSLQRKLFKTVVSGSIDPDEEAEQDSTYFETVPISSRFFYESTNGLSCRFFIDATGVSDTAYSHPLFLLASIMASLAER